jgi:hypothetical protein
MPSVIGNQARDAVLTTQLLVIKATLRGRTLQLE